MTVYALALAVVAVVIGAALYRQRPCRTRDWATFRTCTATGRHTVHVWTNDEHLARYPKDFQCRVTR